MGYPMWVLAKLLSNAATVASIQWYLHGKLGMRNHPRTRVFLGGLLFLAVISLFGFLETPAVIPLLAVFCMAYALLAAGGSFKQKAVHAATAFLLVVASGLTVAIVFSLMPGIVLDSSFQYSPYKMLSLVLSRMLFFILILVFSLKKPARPSGWSQWVIVAAVPLISMAMLTMLYHCIPLYAGEDLYELSALSIGLLAINIMIMALYATLSARANKLAATQQMLQQAELQNKYYHEVLAASDNMQGFRHDVKNHLQVLGGFLEMNNTKKAKQYLDEIGIFLCENEITVNFGYPLLDAVLGGKIALAKSMGVDIRHCVLLDREINMDQMDLCSILGNTLDNALEECARMGGGKAEKYVFIELENTADAIRLTVGNSAGPAGGPPAGSMSSKQGEGHGIGLAIVRRAVEKYGGTMETGHDGAAYQVRISIPAKQPDRPHPPH